MHLKLLPPMLSHHNLGNSACKLVHSKLRPSHEYSSQSEVYQQKIAAATTAFFALVDDWVSIQEAPLSNFEQVYRTVLNGPAPDIGYVVVSEL